MGNEKAKYSVPGTVTTLVNRVLRQATRCRKIQYLESFWNTIRYLLSASIN
jgi:hypothetical protein